jgi:peptidoglycan hydrolase-like protein with peptidoglycan-binding domain
MVGEEGFPIDMDGLYGPKTRDAVVAFQKAFDLGSDGIVGKNTLVKMGDAMQDKIDAGGPLADANFDLATALPSPDEGIVFGYKMEPAEPALVPVPAEDEEMSNDKFVEFMEDLGLPLTSAQLAQLDVDGPEAVVGDLAAGPRSKVKAEVERISLPGLDVQQPERLGGSEYPDVADIDDIWAED